jgi:predicted  nucleic acid-binding Zn-ribbon protein
MAKKPVKAPVKKAPAKKAAKAPIAKATKTVKSAKSGKVVKSAVKTKSVAKPVKKAAKPVAAKKPVKPVVKSKVAVKATPKKNTKPVKPAAKKAVSKPVKKAVAKKAVQKAVPKKAAKPLAKKVVKPATKKVVKPVAKKVVKPATKKVVKPVAKKVVKPIAKKVEKTQAKPVAKKEVKPTTQKVEKPTAKKAEMPPAAKAPEPKKPVVKEAPVAQTTAKPAAAKPSNGKEDLFKPAFQGIDLDSTRPLRPKVPVPSPDAAVKPVANPIYVPPAPDGKPGIKFAPIAIIEKPKEKSNKSEEEDMSSKTAPRLAFAESDDKKGISVEAKLRALYAIQLIDSRIDKIHAMRGELPLEVHDLEDDVAGLEARLVNLTADVKNFTEEISGKKNGIKNSEALIVKYKEQLNNVKNNREYDSLNKEIEFQELEIQLHNKRIKEFEISLNTKAELLTTTEGKLQERNVDLKLKRAELDDIVASTEKEEQILRKKSEEAKKLVEERLMNAYERIRSGAPNGMAVVPIEREASAGSFIQLPPQKQLDVASRKRVMVDEHSGRILVDAELAMEEQTRMDEELAIALK